VIVLEIDEDRRRISLGIKQCKVNPWAEFAESHKEQEKVKGTIRSITDFGLFIGLAGEIDGLVHLSDISWSEPGEEAVRNYKKGDEVEAIILSIDPERERISLGIKQMEEDPLANFMDGINPEDVIKAKVVSVEAKEAVMQITDDTTALMRISDYSYDRVKNLQEELTVGEDVEVKIVNVDRKTRQIYVSHKVLETAPSGGGSKTRAVGGAPTKTTLGDLLKEQMQNDKDK